MHAQCVHGEHAACSDWQTPISPFEADTCSCHCHLSPSAFVHERECSVPDCRLQHIEVWSGQGFGDLSRDITWLIAQLREAQAEIAQLRQSCAPCLAADATHVPATEALRAPNRARGIAWCVTHARAEYVPEDLS